MFLELLPQQHELLQAEARLHRRGQRRVVTTFFLLSRCSPAANAAAAAQALFTDEPQSPTAVRGAQVTREADNLICEEDYDFSVSPLRCSAKRRQRAAYLSAVQQRALLQPGFRTNLKQCCLRLLREAEALDEAAWRRLVQQSALVQATLDGPLSASQLGAGVQEMELHGEGCSQPTQSLGCPEHQQHQLQQQQEYPTQEQEDHITSPDLEVLERRATSEQPSTAAAPEVEGHLVSPPLDKRESKPAGSPHLSSSFFRAFRFRVSRYTQRIHVFSEGTDKPLGLSLAPAEIETATAAAEPIVQRQQQQVLQQAARCYWNLFCQLSSFDKRRFREASWTVQEIEEYIHRRQGSHLQHVAEGTPEHPGQEISDAQKTNALFESPKLSPCLTQTAKDDVAAAPAVLPPRHTTDPLLLLQTAQQQQRRLHTDRLSHESGEWKHSGHISGSSNVLFDQSRNSAMPPSEYTSGAVSKYFSSSATSEPPHHHSEGTSQKWEQRRPATTRTPASTADAESMSAIILIPVIIHNMRAAAQTPSAVSRHMQPYCPERQTLLCVSCLQPVSALSTTRAFLRLDDATEYPSSMSFSSSQHGGAFRVGHLTFSQQPAVVQEAAGLERGITGLVQEANRRAVKSDLNRTPSPGVLQMPTNEPQSASTKEGALSANIAQGCLIRCTEQDLTCSGRCLDAYAARRRRAALRRQVSVTA